MSQTAEQVIAELTAKLNAANAQNAALAKAVKSAPMTRIPTPKRTMDELKAAMAVLCQYTNLSKTFKTGSTGMQGNGQVEIDGAKYTVNLNIIRNGSKPASAE